MGIVWMRGGNKLWRGTVKVHFGIVLSFCCLILWRKPTAAGAGAKNN